ncbi:efflux RND transporter periplasmic adaptor subunit [Salipaludibacillus sp. HK11]|uniref:efflux RND transporter periplasmic adaptor subunit n=1 Tax=Salipaludibacillus sp. HK11 TaxID=3394320 RepID=UPI0039FDB4D3
MLKKMQFYKNGINQLIGLFSVGLLLLLLSACAIFPTEEAMLEPPLVEPAQTEFETEEVIKGDIYSSVSGSANFTAINKTNVYYTETDGRIKEIHVRPNDEVEEGDLLVELETGDLSFDIELLELDLEKAKQRLSQIENSDGDQYETTISRLDVEGLQLRLDKMNQDMEGAFLRAPMSGIITFISEHQSGDYIESYHTLVQISDPENLEIIYTASSSNTLSDVDLGMDVQITYDNQELAGEVIQTPRDLPSDISEESIDLYDRSLLIDLTEDRPDSVAKGDLVNIEVVTEKSEETLMISRGALRTFSGREYVQVVDEDGSLREVDVRTGIVSSTQVEILEGLNEGDQVIIR